MSHLEWPDAALRPVLACGAVLGAFCGLVGTFAVARRESLQGDTVAHAALPGLMLAILLGLTGESAWLAGAAASGWLALGVVQLAGSRRPTTPDAALAGGLAVFFGLGLVLMARVQAGGLVPSDKPKPQRFLFGQAAAELRWDDLTPLAITSAVGAVTALVLWRPLVATSFDPAFGQTVGLSRRLMTGVMTFLVVLAVVAGLRGTDQRAAHRPGGGGAAVERPVGDGSTLGEWHRRGVRRRRQSAGPRPQPAGGDGADRPGDRADCYGRRARLALAGAEARASRREPEATAGARAARVAGGGVAVIGILPAEREAMLLCAAVAACCALPGAFLVFRRLALLGDAMSHVLLLGIVVAYLAVGDLTSPWLLVGAALSGLVTVLAVQALERSGRVKGDAAIGLVFPALFSLGAILASLYCRQTHLDVDSVMLGHVELAGLPPPVTVGGVSLGRAAALSLFGFALVQLLLLVLAYKELTASAFDPAFAAVAGLAPGSVQLALMLAASGSIVLSFDAAGPVLVVAFLVLPASAARLLSDRLSRVLALSVVIGVAGAAGGVRLAFALGKGGSVAGTVAATLGAIFAACWLFAPRRGLVAEWWRQRRAVRGLLAQMRQEQGESPPSATARSLHPQ